MSQETISELIVSLGLDTKDFDTNIKNVNKSTKTLEQSFNNAKKALALSERSVEDFNKAIDSGENVIKQYNSKIDALGKAYKEQQEKLKKFIQQQKELPDQISKAERELKDLEQTLGKGSQEYKEAENKLKTYKQQLNNMDTTINKSVNSLRSLENQIQATKNKMTQAENEVTQYRNELNELDDVNSNSENSSSIFDSIKESMSGIDIGDFTGQIGGLDSALGLLKGGAVAAGAALAGMFVNNAIDAAKEYDKVITDLQISLGLTKDKAIELNNKIRLFSDGGYNVESIAEAVELLSQRFSMTDGEVEKISQGMSILNDYGYETNDMVRFITMAYDNWGMSAEDALGMIIRGQQDGMNIAGDLMDTFIEYTPILGQMGVSGQDAFTLISSAMQDTGMDSDKVADMMKELTLTITDGSSTSAEALKGVGIDADDLTNRIDSGKITMTDAFKEVATAILGIKDETERAKAMQDIFKGTVEYGNDTVLQSWVNIENQTLNAKGAIDEVTQAYENSYQASQQDFSNSWNELSQTLGTIFLPLLTSVMDALTGAINDAQAGVSNFGMACQVFANQLKAFFLEVGISILENLAKLPLADQIMPNLNSTLEQMKESHKSTIDYIQNTEKTMADNAALINGKYESDKNQTFSNVANIADTKTQEMANAVANNTTKAKDSAKQNVDGLKSDVESSLSGLGNIATDATGKIPKATQQNLSESAKIIRQFGSDAYNGVRTSFSKLEQASKQSFSNLYNGCNTSMSKLKTNTMKDATSMYLNSKKSFDALNIAGRRAFSNLYNGVTNSSSKMRSRVIADWNAIRAALNQGITGKVVINKSINTDTGKKSLFSASSFSALEAANNSIAKLSTDNIDYNSVSNYRPNTIVSSSSKRSEQLNTDTIIELKKQNSLLTDMLNILMNERTTVIENTITMDGREVARGTAKYIKSEIGSFEKRQNRLAGVIR